MANTSRIKGLRPIMQPYGNTRVTYYVAETSNAIYLFQPVSLNGAGQVGLAGVGSQNALVGSVVSLLTSEWAPISADQGYLPASINAMVGVTDDPNQRYLIEEDTGGSALTQAAIGNGVSMTYINAGTGNNASGLSNIVMDRSTINVSSGQQLRIIGLCDAPDNAYGDYAKWVVQIHEHQFNPSSDPAQVNLV